MKILCLGEISPSQTALMRMRRLEWLGYCAWRPQVGAVEACVMDQPAGAAANSSRIYSEKINSAVLAAAHQFKASFSAGNKAGVSLRGNIAELQKFDASVVHFTLDPYFSLDLKRPHGCGHGAFDVLVYCKSYGRKRYELLGKPLIYMPLIVTQNDSLRRRDFHRCLQTAGSGKRETGELEHTPEAVES